jgi:hypothetical protein
MISMADYPCLYIMVYGIRDIETAHMEGEQQQQQQKGY